MNPEASRIRFRPQRHPLRRSSHQGARVRRRLPPQGLVNRIGDLVDEELPNQSSHPPNSSRCKSINEIASTSGLRR
jgi:hypothetical protein